MATSELVTLCIAAGAELAQRWGEPLTRDTLLGGCREVARVQRMQGAKLRAGELYDAARAELGWS